MDETPYQKAESDDVFLWESSESESHHFLPPINPARAINIWDYWFEDVSGESSPFEDITLEDSE